MSAIDPMDVELVVDAHAEVGEGPMWDPVTQCLFWVDIPHGLIHRFSPTTGADTTIELGRPVSVVVRRECGGFVLGVPEGFAALSEDGEVTLLAEVEADLPANRMNDGKCDRRGRFWAGTMSTQFVPRAGALYRLDADLSVHRMVADVTTSNGIAWSLDDRLMYYIDTRAYRLDVFDFDVDSGAISNRRPLVDFAGEAGRPDGMTIDAEGHLWVALYGGSAVRRFAPDGSLDREIGLPVRQVTSCAFGGPDLADLYVTTAAQELPFDAPVTDPHAGGLFRIRPGPVGLRANTFAG